ncbi:FecCD family ABC transporter permease [Corynebacterium pseudodiphtheriticum]|jgi:cobalamin/fe3+-siderophores transport systems, permease component|uniref:Iron ABC transporter permease n=1 Tax=Corynebacterium pseudodiphtheriticum TaxID=37637 RepID=A0ABT7FXT0_9CORY|nr:iron ABC transporter permease [Corynebacterium pseudodiphtheriticum]MCG7251885.1 iron ABC transporter permease [Corynebacterium pseudodiphtheriticum]MDK4207444.1 iron ABC transporter permease [Corynebacterium pseudodiphtheriticum]MDK4290790.1 iron ABC transporter permease [Corynebacterium pseudodiphtheriticum]MDK4317300.1 iron ABC transporter permease [Corynebacterium pseudodiphtheriticum]MDK8806534.1 iron ABC transporter permease [Corynebacterium pseudodiphtheriticum]
MDRQRTQQVLRARNRNRVLLFIVLVFALVSGTIASLVIGQYTIPIGELPRILAVGPLGVSAMDESVIWQIRLPRLVLGLLVGAALGVGGALMQAVFANPLAEPSVIGVTAGAGVGASLAIVLGISWFGATTVPVFAFLSGLLTTWLVYQLARFAGRIRVINLVLVGIAVNAVAGALISFFIFIAPTSSREQVVFWQMGSLSGAKWAHISVVAVLIGAGIAVALLLVGKLDVLALGDRAAGHVGIDIARLRVLALLLATLLTAGAVSYAGLIGFVGLVVPHIIRTVAGPSNVVLLPASALGGAALIVLADTAARSIIDFADLPIGIFTALVGGPTFFILLRAMMRRGAV